MHSNLLVFQWLGVWAFTAKGPGWERKAFYLSLLLQCVKTWQTASPHYHLLKLLPQIKHSFNSHRNPPPICPVGTPGYPPNPGVSDSFKCPRWNHTTEIADILLIRAKQTPLSVTANAMLQIYTLATPEARASFLTNTLMEFSIQQSPGTKDW